MGHANETYAKRAPARRGIRFAILRELGHGLALVGITGSSVGGVVGVVALATRVWGR